MALRNAHYTHKRNVIPPNPVKTWRNWSSNTLEKGTLKKPDQTNKKTKPKLNIYLFGVILLFQGNENSWSDKNQYINIIADLLDSQAENYSASLQ